MAELHTDFPERFEDRRDLSGFAANGSRRELQLQEHWFHKGGVVLKFEGVDSIRDAEQLAGMEVQIPREQRATLEDGATYVSELVGCEVWVASESGLRLLGGIAEVEFVGGAAPLLVIRGEGKQEYLVPYAEEFLQKQDVANRRIELVLPEGLLELQAPLSSEETQRQKLEAEEARAAGESRSEARRGRART